MMGLMSGSWLSGRFAGKITARQTIKRGYLIMGAATMCNVALNLALPPALLDEVTALVEQDALLFGGLHAFRDHFQTQAVTKGNNGRGDGACRTAFLDLAPVRSPFATARRTGHQTRSGCLP